MAILDHTGAPFKQDVLHEPQTSSLIHLQRQVADHPAKGITRREVLPLRIQGIFKCVFKFIAFPGGFSFSDVFKSQLASFSCH